MTDVFTMNLSDSGDGMVSLNNNNKSTNFIVNEPPVQQTPPTLPPPINQQMPNIMPEKNISQNKQTMDSTAISLCMDNDLPIVVFDLMGDGNVGQILAGESVGTVVS